MTVTDIGVIAHTREPNPEPIRDALQELPGSGSVRVIARTDDGIEGSGDVYFGRTAGGPEALKGLVEHVLKPIAVGTSLDAIRATHQAMLAETEYHGSFGLAMFGIAAIDTALWDCLGNTLGAPCWQLWGGMNKTIPAYAMVGWLNYDDEQISRICAQAADQGFGAVKIKVGYPTMAEDLRRVQVVRQAVGDAVEIMVDANQSLTTKEAIRRGHAFADLGCFWWEEPLPADDVDGYAALCDACAIPIGTGENLYTPADFARFLKRDAVDIVQPDLRRAGGPSAMLAIGQMAAAFRRPYASHGGDPVQMNVMACLPNAMYLETGLIGPDSPVKLVDGRVSVPTGPGFGWE